MAKNQTHTKTSEQMTLERRAQKQKQKKGSKSAPRQGGFSMQDVREERREADKQWRLAQREREAQERIEREAAEIRDQIKAKGAIVLPPSQSKLIRYLKDYFQGTNVRWNTLKDGKVAFAKKAA